MKTVDFVKGFIEKRVMNTKVDPDAVGKYIKETLEVEEYIPFNTKRRIVDKVIKQNIEVIDGVKKNDPISQYVSFVIAMLIAHTNLEISDNPVDDYDELSRNGLLMPVIETFKTDYNECDVLLKMALASELEDNNMSFVVGKFLNGIVEKLGSFNLNSLIKEEDMAKIAGLLDKLS